MYFFSEVDIQELMNIHRHKRYEIYDFVLFSTLFREIITSRIMYKENEFDVKV